MWILNRGEKIYDRRPLVHREHPPAPHPQQPTKGSCRAGWPWHEDVESNGTPICPPAQPPTTGFRCYLWAVFEPPITRIPDDKNNCETGTIFLTGRTPLSESEYTFQRTSPTRPIGRLRAQPPIGSYVPHIQELAVKDEIFQ